MSWMKERDFHDDGSGHEGYTFECDGKPCTESYAAEGSFTEVWEEAKQEGWQARKNALNGVWDHYCDEHAHEVQ